MKKPRVVVTGLGVVSSIGIGWKAFWESLLRGKSGIKPIRYIDTSNYPTHLGGEVHGFDPRQFIEEDQIQHFARGAQFGIAATKMALEDALLTQSGLNETRVGVAVGTTMADIEELEAINEAWVRHDETAIPAAKFLRYPSCVLSGSISRYFGFHGPNIMIPTACAAGNYAIGYAADLLRDGRADVMLAGGIDPFSRIAFTGFNRIFAVAPEKCQPFDKNRKGTLIGEGAGILVLERYEHAKARNASIYAEILGYGLTCDANHMTIPESASVERVMRKALDEANIGTNEVDYVSAHGTGTVANDRSESAAIRRIFDLKKRNVPISSIKSMLGHAMGAASALEAICCCLAIKHGRVPPTINFESSDPECEIDCIPNISRTSRTRVALNNSFAFGGNNAGVVLSEA